MHITGWRFQCQRWGKGEQTRHFKGKALINNNISEIRLWWLWTINWFETNYTLSISLTDITLARCSQLRQSLCLQSQYVGERACSTNVEWLSPASLWMNLDDILSDILIEMDLFPNLKAPFVPWGYEGNASKIRGGFRFIVWFSKEPLLIEFSSNIHPGRLIRPVDRRCVGL